MPSYVPVDQVSGKKYLKQPNTRWIPSIPDMLGVTDNALTRRAIINPFMSFPLFVPVWALLSFCAALGLLTSPAARPQTLLPGEPTKLPSTEVTVLPGFKVEKIYSV